LQLSKEDIGQIAHLARLELTDEETDKLTGHMNRIMEYFAELQALDTEDVEPTSHVIPIENVLREDMARPSFSTEDIVANAPEERDGCFVVPRIVET